MNRSVTHIVRRLLVSGLMLLIHRQALGAQDVPSTSFSESVPAKAPSTAGSDWTGFYLGAHFGTLGLAQCLPPVQPVR